MISLIIGFILKAFILCIVAFVLLVIISVGVAIGLELHDDHRSK